MAKISESTEKRLREHAKNHTPKHMSIMRQAIMDGDSFQTAHQKAIKQVGKKTKKRGPHYRTD